jgi:DNA-binding transcriptional ArsR family regulator
MMPRPIAKVSLQNYLCGMTDPTFLQMTPERVKALAHPLRVRLLWLLRERGPSTATRLAEVVGQSSGVTSYHLRQLARHGFVLEEADRGNGRDRWWRAVHRGSTLDSSQARQVPEESEAYMRAIAALYAERVDRFIGELATMPPEWQDASDLSDYALRLTQPEAIALHDELRGVIAKYRRYQPEDPGPVGAKVVVLQVTQMPLLARA